MGWGTLSKSLAHTWSSVYSTPVPNLEDGKLFGGLIHRIDDPVVADAVLEASLPFLSLKRLMAKESVVLSHPRQLVQNARLQGRIEAPDVLLRFGC